jgi:hypothetical protein
VRTTRRIETDYFWRFDPETSTQVTSRPEEVTSSERLRVACTQTGLPPRQQAALVRQWCEVLPALDHVQLLWLESQVPQVLFDAACRMPRLRGLYVKWSNVTRIDSLCGLEDLHYLHLGSSTRVRSIEVLAKLSRLK